MIAALKHVEPFEAAGTKDALKKWDALKTACFRIMRPQAFTVVATDSPMTIILRDPDGTVRDIVGAETGVWPAWVVRTEKTETTDHNTRVFGFSERLRLWTYREEHRDDLADDAEAILVRRAEIDGTLKDARRVGRAIGSAFDFAELQARLEERALARGLLAMSNAELSAFLDGVALDVARVAGQRGAPREELISSIVHRRWGVLERDLRTRLAAQDGTCVPAGVT